MDLIAENRKNFYLSTKLQNNENDKLLKTREISRHSNTPSLPPSPNRSSEKLPLEGSIRHVHSSHSRFRSRRPEGPLSVERRDRIGLRKFRQTGFGSGD